jgi:hypothetical protein
VSGERVLVGGWFRHLSRSLAAGKPNASCCETTSEWASAVALYLECGFFVTHEADGDTYFERLLV